MFFSLSGYVVQTIIPKESRAFKLAVWNLFEENLSWEEAKSKRKKYRGTQIVPQTQKTDRKKEDANSA